jgi:hypothetical protein
LAPAPRAKGTNWGLIFVLLLFAGGGYYLYAARSGKTVTTAISGPTTLVSESFSLDEGQARSWSFSLPAPRQVEVSVRSSSKDVNVYFMDEAQFAVYEKARKEHGRFEYRTVLSGLNVRAATKGEIIPEGRWHVIVELERTSVLTTDTTNVSVLIKSY